MSGVLAPHRRRKAPGRTVGDCNEQQTSYVAFCALQQVLQRYHLSAML
jgi:hypothetical protein